MAPAPELSRAEEEPVRRSSGLVVETMSPTDPTEEPEPEKKPRDGQALVNEPVVDEDVSDPEEGHPHAHADEDGARQTMELAAEDEDPRGDRGVEHGQRVVPLEAADPWFVVRAVNAPELAMPHPSMEQARPRLHRTRDDQSDDERFEYVRRSPTHHLRTS